MKIGFLGGGQLARMMALAGYPLGLQFRCIDANPESPAGDLMEHIVAPLTDKNALQRFADDLDLATIESENIPVSTLEQLIDQGLSINPGTKALAISQDRLFEKTLFQKLGIPTAAFSDIASESALEEKVKARGGAFILKTRRDGYDGKGQYRIKSPADVSAAWKALGGRDLILEQWLSFDAECSLISVRDTKGKVKFYPLVRNVHREGILFTSEPWTGYSHLALQTQAEDFANRILQELDYVGVLTIELFVLGNQLVANEIAPRVHNSGHWTIEAAMTSQFENHLRAIMGWPLGSTDIREDFKMINIISQMPLLQDLSAIEGVHVHSYNKRPAPKRKLGHITVLKPSRITLDTLLKVIAE